MSLSGAFNSTEICSKLIERHPQITYLSINDIANIDAEEPIEKQDHRYDSIQRYIEQHRTSVRAFLIAGHLDEKNFVKKWQEKVIVKDSFDLVFLLYPSFNKSI